MGPLSDEQMLAVEHGLHSNHSWEDVPLVEGLTKKDLPDWLKDLHVKFFDEPRNMTRPWYSLEVTAGAYSWEDAPDLFWTFDPKLKRYSAISHDGTRARFYYHNAPSMRPVTVHAGYEVYKEGEGKPEWVGKSNYSKPITKQEKWYTTNEDRGFGGSHIRINLKDAEHPDGIECVLRGPWHGGCPQGWVECGANHGVLTISEEVFIKAVSVLQPHLRLARVTIGSVTRLEIRRDGQPPKGFTE